MIKKLLALAAVAALGSAQAQTTGSMAFTAFNADEDGWTMVMLESIAANTQVYFSDGTATSATAIGANEMTLLWNTGGSAIAAGSVVRFSAVDASTRAASVGTFTAISLSNPGLSATAETVYAFLGTSATAPSTIITAVSNEADTASLTIVGLTAGVNAIKLTSSADFAGYTGTRNGLATFAAYRPLVNTASNWFIDVGGDGATVVPNTMAFTVAVPEPGTYALMFAGLLAVGFVARRRS